MELGCIFSYINKLGTISNKFITKRIKEEGLPILQNHALLFFILPEDKSPLLFSEIVDRGKISKSSLSDIINKYENLGLVNKSISNEDKRNLYINLTDDGINVKSKLEDIKYEALAIMLDGFDENQKEKQLELLEIHRNQLLIQIHKEEKKISCLDYLIYQIKK